MIRKRDLPEEAQEEPRTLSPEESAKRATRRLELFGELKGLEEAECLADPTTFPALRSIALKFSSSGRDNSSKVRSLN
jgi:hypothetical protein